MNQHARILVVDDHRETLEATARLLSAEGFEVTPAFGVTDALAACEGRAFDVLVSDLELNDGFGIELLGQVKERFDVRGIMVTGLQADDQAELVREAGYDAMLLKPVEPTRLVATVREVLGRGKVIGEV